MSSKVPFNIGYCNVFSALKLLLKRNNITFLFCILLFIASRKSSNSHTKSTFVFLHVKRFYAIIIRYYLKLL